MAKVVRQVLYKGKLYRVEFAVTRDGARQPALTFIEELKAGTLKQDPDHQGRDGWPDEAQPADWSHLLTRMRYFADNGEPQSEKHLNALRDGLWEFKRRSKRVTFFDTDGEGGDVPKGKIRHRDEAPEDIAETDYWWVPYFDPYIRIGYSFVKNSQKTLSAHIVQGLRIREGDLAHDQESAPEPQCIQP